jgi:hypothetical protein
MVTVGDKFEAGVGLCVGADFYWRIRSGKLQEFARQLLHICLSVRLPIAWTAGRISTEFDTWDFC